MRTIKRKALHVNMNKNTALIKLCHAYAREKDHWLNQLKSWNYQEFLGRPRKIRDEFVKKGYRSNVGLQARHWKIALQDAVETWNKYWMALFAQARAKISQGQNLSEKGRHYAYWLLKGYQQFSSLMQGREPLPHFPIEETERKQAACSVRRMVRKLKGRPPRVKKERIAKFDANCYECFEHHGRQYLKLMSLERGNRLIIPLMGYSKIEGNITIVLVKDGLEIHTSQELKSSKKIPSKSLEAIDFGYSEVLTDSQGIRYGKQFGKILTKTSHDRHVKMQKRHRLHAIEKKLRKENPIKAARLRKYNLGRKKLNEATRKAKATLDREINTGINELIQSKNLSVLITEDLSHIFTYHQPKNMNRMFSGWCRGKLQERIAFKALAEGFRHEQVNPAYGSQTCLNCDFVDRKNRNADKFKCLYCGHEDIADRVAAQNYARRFGDQEIGRYVPYNQVKTILLDRFHRRLETGQPVTVPGRTLDTV